MTTAFAIMILAEFQRAINCGSLKIVDLDPYLPVSYMAHAWPNVDQAITTLSQQPASPPEQESERR